VRAYTTGDGPIYIRTGELAIARLNSYETAAFVDTPDMPKL
jgi:hypothetical protein